ncbi:beta-ketoacyl synthase [Immersiella caudata]|uniref:Beta-ketoacyl synthase n=1 Tax=Immersiella caudata TaxID=314043 RepID=A0AA39XFQ0_9PEZI|nr:beta-ketoacyl synthase [Immersiella caudata]
MTEKENIDASSPTPIAIVGVACRFPGDASSPENLWNVLSKGKSAWREFPADRLNINGFYHPSVRSDSFNFKGAHFIDEDVSAFDAKFFGVAQAEADAIDPQQRILLEVSYEAVENAGFPMETFQGSNTCVFIGSFVKDYEQISMRDSQTTAP